MFHSVPMAAGDGWEVLSVSQGILETRQVAHLPTLPDYFVFGER